MKIGLVCPYNIYRGGGVQECVLAMQTELIKRGHEVYIITPQPRDSTGQQGQNILFLGGSADVKSPLHTTAQVSFNANTEAIRSVIDTYHFDILHFHEPWVPIMSWQLLSKSQSINIATFHAKLPDTMMSKTIEKVITPYTRSVLKYLDELTAVSSAAQMYVSDLTQEPITIIPNGIDLNKYRGINNAANHANIVLYIGRLEKRKGVKYLLKAFQLLEMNQPDAQLILAGDGPDRSKLEQAAKQLGINNVHFLGYVTEAKKLELLASASVFCAPALYGESFGIVLLEAMAAGVPTVAGDNPGYSAVLKETGQLSLVNPRQVPELARRLEIMLVDKKIREAWCAWAAQYIEQFDYVSVVDQYEALYKRAVKKDK